MTQIDFLPSRYRDRHVHRQNSRSRLVVVLATAALLAAGFYAMRMKRDRVTGELDAVRQGFDLLMQQTDDLNKLSSRVKALRHQAELLAYLRHPWSRARIVQAVLEPMPESVVLETLNIGEATASQLFRSPGEQVRGNSKGKQTKQLSPAQSDLLRLRAEADQRPLMVFLAGTLHDHAAIHRYVQQLGASKLFMHVELLGIDPRESSRNIFGFKLQLTVSPGYGQPRGPKAPPAHPPAKLDGLSTALRTPGAVSNSSEHRVVTAR